MHAVARAADSLSIFQLGAGFICPGGEFLLLLLFLPCGLRDLSFNRFPLTTREFPVVVNFMCHLDGLWGTQINYFWVFL